MVGLLLLALTSPALATPEEEATRLAESFIAAANAGRLEQARALCAEPLLSEARPTCETIVRDLHQGALTLDPAGVTARDQTAVLLYWAKARSGDTPVWLLARQTPSGWRLVEAGSDELPPKVDFPIPERGPHLPRGMSALPPHVLAMADAANSGDRARLEPLCAPELLERGCGALAAQVARGNRWHVVGLEVADGRQLVRLRLVVDGRDRDKAFLFLLPEGDGWKIAYIDSHEPHARDFIAGTLPATVAPADLVDNPKAAELVSALRSLASGKASREQLGFVDGVGQASLSKDWLGARGPVDLDITWGRWLSGSDRYAVCFVFGGTPQIATWRHVEGTWRLLKADYTSAACEVGIASFVDWDG